LCQHEGGVGTTAMASESTRNSDCALAEKVFDERFPPSMIASGKGNQRGIWNQDALSDTPTGKLFSRNQSINRSHAHPEESSSNTL